MQEVPYRAFKNCRQNITASDLLIFIWSVIGASGELGVNLMSAPDIVDKTTVSGISDKQ